MLCPRCQAENREGRRFCAECGASLALACPSCGFSNEPGEKFCGGCGMGLAGSRPIHESRFDSPQAYTPRHLAEKILTSKSALEGERGYEAWALRLFGEIASHPDSPEAESAQAHYRQAMTLSEELGMRPLLDHCRLGLGRLYRRAEKPQHAREHLTTATTMFRQMDTRFWLEKAEAETKELNP